jgi:hypothetical protein
LLFPKVVDFVDITMKTKNQMLAMRIDVHEWHTNTNAVLETLHKSNFIVFVFTLYRCCDEVIVGTN